MVGANDPIPSVSKKLVTAPRTITSTRGHSTRATAARSSVAAQITPASANALSKMVSRAPPVSRTTDCIDEGATAPRCFILLAEPKRAHKGCVAKNTESLSVIQSAKAVSASGRRRDGRRDAGDAVGQAGAGGPDTVRGVDGGGSAEARSIPGSALRQGRARGAARTPVPDGLSLARGSPCVVRPCLEKLTRNHARAPQTLGRRDAVENSLGW